MGTLNLRLSLQLLFSTQKLEQEPSAQNFHIIKEVFQILRIQIADQKKAKDKQNENSHIRICKKQTWEIKVVHWSFKDSKTAL